MSSLFFRSPFITPHFSSTMNDSLLLLFYRGCTKRFRFTLLMNSITWRKTNKCTTDYQSEHWTHNEWCSIHSAHHLISLFKCPLYTLGSAVMHNQPQVLNQKSKGINQKVGGKKAMVSKRNKTRARWTSIFCCTFTHPWCSWTDTWWVDTFFCSCSAILEI